MYITPLTQIVMVMRGLVFHPLICMVLTSGSYLVCLCMRACSGNLSWQYVNWNVCWEMVIWVFLFGLGL